MKYIKSEKIGNDNIMIIYQELDCLFYVAIESAQNYGLNPYWTSKAYKSRSGALNNYKKVLDKMKSRL